MLPMQLQGYAIYNPATQLWSKGGCTPSWKKNPKVWSGIGPLKGHLNMFVNRYYAHSRKPDDVSCFIISRVYDGCLVYDVTTGEPFDANWINEYYFDYMRRSKAESKYDADRPVKFQGTNEWLLEI